jgi:glucose-6-phosphate dehydrogenase assembly protein OpcA
MATKYKVLGQSAPAATTATTLYTVPSSTYAVVSTITVANRSSTSGTYRIAIRPNAATLSNEHYIAYDATVPGNDTIAITLGITADAADIIEVYASSADLSFNAFGSEIDE